MRIQGWHLDRAGALHEHEARDLPEGLIVVCGPNGSGKSALFAFLQHALFGRPGPHAGDPAMPLPELRAGRVWCEGPEGVLTIGHEAGPSPDVDVRLPDGARGGSADIETWLGGAASRLVGSLLAFNADDLRAFPTWARSVVGRATPPGACRRLEAIRRAIQHAEARLAELQERVGDPRCLLDIPSSLQERIDRACRAARDCGNLLRAQAHQRAEIAARARAASSLRDEQTRYDTLIELRPIWEALARARRELADCEPPVPLPDDVEARLTAALGDRDAAHQALRQATARATAPEVTTKDLIQWQHRLRDVVDAVRESEAELAAVRRRLIELEADRDRLQATLGPEPPPAATLDEWDRLAHRVNAALADIAKDEAAIAQSQDRIATGSRDVRELEGRVVRQPSRFFTFTGWMGAVGGASAGLWFYAAGDVTASAALGVCALVGGVGALVERSRRKAAATAEMARRLRLVDARTELQSACQDLLAQQEHALRRRFDIGVDSTRLGLPALPSVQQLRRLERDLADRRRRRELWDMSRASWTDVVAAVDDCRELERDQARAVMNARAAQRTAIAEWQAWKAGAGLTGTDQDERAAGAGAGGRIAAHAGAAVACETEAPARDARDSQSPDRQTPAVRIAEERAALADSRLAQLLVESGVSDEDGLRARLDASKRYQQARREVDDYEALLREHTIEDPATGARTPDLSEGSLEQWRARADGLSAELADLERAQAAAIRDLQQMDQEIGAIASKVGDLSGTAVEMAARTAEATEAIREWRALAIARALLADTERATERLAQPPAVRAASRRFFTITGRYELLRQPGTRCDLSVVDARGGRKVLDQLSRATLEQLQFSLRLGVADELERCGVRLPLLMDDVLDHGDPARRRAMVEQVVEISRGRQVFVFTSDPETQELLCRKAAAIHTIALQEA